MQCLQGRCAALTEWGGACDGPGVMCSCAHLAVRPLQVECLLASRNLQRGADGLGPQRALGARILVMCYTNHALDQFMLGLSKVTTNIVRVVSGWLGGWVSTRCAVTQAPLPTLATTVILPHRHPPPHTHTWRGASTLAVAWACRVIPLALVLPAAGVALWRSGRSLLRTGPGAVQLRGPQA